MAGRKGGTRGLGAPVQSLPYRAASSPYHPAWPGNPAPPNPLSASSCPVSLAAEDARLVLGLMATRRFALSFQPLTPRA